MPVWASGEASLSLRGFFECFHRVVQIPRVDIYGGNGEVGLDVIGILFDGCCECFDGPGLFCWLQRQLVPGQ